MLRFVASSATSQSSSFPSPVLAARLALLRTPGLGPRTVARLDAEGHALERLVGAPRGRLRRLGLAEASAAWLAAPDGVRIAADARWLAARSARLLWRDDPDYPERLRSIAAPPLGLFVLGRAELLGEPQIAVVGARAASRLGCDLATRFAGALARCGLVVTSGLALGVDGAAHRAALDFGGASLAVCGTGLDRVYPRRHAPLAEALARSGALVSELPLGAAPRAEHFPRRNRIIAGLALGVLVVEAARRSGSLITARLAAEQGREVFAVPGSLATAKSRGCHDLIREGAMLVEEPEEIVAELAPQLLAALDAPAPSAQAADPPVAGPERVALDALGGEAVTVDTLVSRTGLTPGALSSILTSLELRGLVAREPGARYARRHLSGGHR